MQMSQDINEISAALSKAQGEMRPAEKSNFNPFHKSQYANLDDCWESMRAPLSKNGLAVSQFVEKECVTTMLSHVSGQWFKAETPIMAKEFSSQAYGSAVTYAKKYSASAIVGLTFADKDDDGEAAEGRGKETFMNEILATAKQLAWLTQMSKDCDKEYVENLLKRYNYEALAGVKMRDVNPIAEELKAHINTKKRSA